MTSSVLFGVVAACCCCLVSAAVYHSPLPRKPEEFKDVRGCYIKEVNNVIDFGEQVDPVGYCYRVECSRSYLHYSTCGVVGTQDPKCYITDEDVSVPYPGCCPTVKCDTNYLL